MNARQGKTGGGRGTNQHQVKGSAKTSRQAVRRAMPPDGLTTEEPASFEWALPEGAEHAWRELAPVLPETAYLAGGTALASVLNHRMSADLDFFTDGPFDEQALADAVRRRGTFAVTTQLPGTLNGIFEGTKVQFLDATSQHVLDDFTEVDGVRIASLPDLLATKVKVIADRGELRDYYDLMAIEQQTDLTVEQGLVLFVERYQPASPESAVSRIVRGLGYLEDVNDDPGLPVGRATVESYWAKRAPQIMRWFARQDWA